MSATSCPEGPLHTVYQPIVGVDSERIIGYEALTRGRGKWQLPADLFRHSYQRGFTVALDLQCLKTALKVLPKLGKRRLLFVNVEPVTLGQWCRRRRETNFLLRRIPVERRQIVFELTEGMKTRDFEFIKQGVSFLRGLGFRFAVDDVSGINAKVLKLISLKPDYLKIDMSYVNRVAESRSQQVFIRRLIRLCKRRGIPLIAEGVERKKDLEFFRKAGVPYAQGFYFAHPGRELRKEL